MFWFRNLAPPSEIFTVLCSFVHLFECSSFVKQEGSLNWLNIPLTSPDIKDS